MMRCILLAFALKLTCAQLFGQALDPLDRTAERIIARVGGYRAAWKPEAIALLTSAERATLIRNYRSKLQRLEQPETHPNQRYVETPNIRDKLLRLGDPEILKETIAVILNAPAESSEFQRALAGLISAARPEAILLLMPRIQIDEPLILKAEGDIGALEPKSYGLAASVLDIVSAWPMFSEEVRAWAKKNASARAMSRRELIRQWWGENEKHLNEANYSAVRPGADRREEELALAAKIQIRRQAFREELISSGKDPTDLNNWARWREVILPSLKSSQ